MHFLSYLLARFFIGSLRFMPFWGLYRLSDAMAFLFYHLGYRKQVVLDNLRRCFPEKSEAALRAIAKQSYRNLSDVTLETLKSMVTPIETTLRRVKFHNVQLINDIFATGKSVLLVGGHYNNWEWMALGMGENLHGTGVIIYKTLSNPYMDRWLYASRARGQHIALKSMPETYPAIKEMKGSPCMFILGADQSPSNRRTAQWVSFFGQPTACLPGPDLLGRQFDYPIVYFEIQRVARGYYEVSYETICAKPANTESPQITQIYMDRLAETIQKDPGNWLWSHKRWKMKPEA